MHPNSEAKRQVGTAGARGTPEVRQTRIPRALSSYGNDDEADYTMVYSSTIETEEKDASILKKDARGPERARWQSSCQKGECKSSEIEYWKAESMPEYLMNSAKQNREQEGERRE